MSASLGGEQWHDCWRHILEGGCVRIKLKSGQLYGNEIIMWFKGNQLEIRSALLSRNNYRCLFGSVQTEEKLTILKTIASEHIL